MNDRLHPAHAARATSPGVLAGRSVIVTGGSRGLGAAIGELLGAEGARVVVADLAYERARECAAWLVRRGVDALALSVDVGDERAVRSLFAQVQEVHGGIDILINNAAIDVDKPIAELQASEWERVLRTNLTGPFLMAKHAAQAMLADPRHAARGAAGGIRGHIVNIASTASKRAGPDAAAHHASKWGLLGLSHALHAELRPQRIKVSAVVVGGMRTPLLLDRYPDLDPGLLLEPAHVARTVLFVLTQPDDMVIPEVMVLPMRETSWP